MRENDIIKKVKRGRSGLVGVVCWCKWVVGLTFLLIP